MAETFSLSVTAMDVNDTTFTPATLKIGDSQGRAGSQEAGMRTGQQVLCKRPDGSLAWYSIVPTMSQAGSSIVLQAV
jgi:hypothetical protein